MDTTSDLGGDSILFGEVRCPSGMLLFTDPTNGRFWPDKVTDWGDARSVPFDDDLVDLTLVGEDWWKAVRDAGRPRFRAHTPTPARTPPTPPRTNQDSPHSPSTHQDHHQHDHLGRNTHHCNRLLI